MQHQLAMQLNFNAIIQWLNSYSVQLQLRYKNVFFNQSLPLFIAHILIFQFLFPEVLTPCYFQMYSVCLASFYL